MLESVEDLGVWPGPSVEEHELPIWRCLQARLLQHHPQPRERPSPADNLLGDYRVGPIAPSGGFVVSCFVIGAVPHESPTIPALELVTGAAEQRSTEFPLSPH